MFYHRNGMVFLTKDQHAFCEVEQLEEVIQRLEFLAKEIQKAAKDEEAEPRYTPEGIDRYFKADYRFINDERRWKEDALRDWNHLDGPELFKRYQIHAELYCEGCQRNGDEPSYQGFREWLMFLRDSLEYYQTEVANQ